MDHYNGRALRALARQNLRYHRAAYRPIILTLLVFFLVSYFLQFFLGGIVVISLGLGSFPDMVTGAWMVDREAMTQLLSLGGLDHLAGPWGGMAATLRLDAAGMVFLLLLPWRLLFTTLVVQVIAFLVSSLLYVAFPHRLDAVLGRRPAPSLGALLRRPGFWGKAWLVELPLSILHLLSTRLWLICLLSSLLFSTLGLGPLPLVLLVLMGPLAFFLYTLLLPLRYGLALHPDESLSQAAKAGMELVKGRRKDFFRLCFSFWWCYLISCFIANLPEAYVRPYQDTTLLLFLHNVQP